MGACSRTVLDRVQILIMADNGTMAREQGCSQHGGLSNKEECVKSTFEEPPEPELIFAWGS